eukprot:9204855-Pyramimonas_sp.AAC.1
MYRVLHTSDTDCLRHPTRTVWDVVQIWHGLSTVLNKSDTDSTRSYTKSDADCLNSNADPTRTA